LFEGLEGLEYSFDIVLSKNFGYVISSALDVGKRNEIYGWGRRGRVVLFRLAG
jgi:hypothetical protein